MTGKLRFLIVSSSLFDLASSTFVLDVSPAVPFDKRFPDSGSDIIRLFLEVTPPTLTNTSDPPECTAANGPFGKRSTFATNKTESPWEIRFSTPNDYYLKMDPAAEYITLDILFGSEKCGEEFVTDVHPKNVSLKSTNHIIEQSLINMSPCYLHIMIELKKKEDVDCNILGRKDHDLVFEIAHPLLEGIFVFEPCLSFLTLETGSGSSVEYKPASTAPGNTANVGRLLEDEETCIYCKPGEECACCPTEDPIAHSSSQKPSPAVAGVTLAAISTILGLVNILL
jgi:hypothetical protein